MAQPKDSDRLPSDPAFKAMYSFPRMIADALRGYAVKPNGPLDPRTVAALDFRTLRKLPAEWVTPDFRRRIGDQAWQVRFRWAQDREDPGGYLLILVEFQSSVDKGMALRMAGYTTQLLAELETTGKVPVGGPYPPVFPLVIHNGPRRWTASTTLHGLIAKPRPPVVATVRPEDVQDARRAADDLAGFQLRHAYFGLDFDRHRGDDPKRDNAVSLQISLESASTLDAMLRPVALLRGFTPTRLARTMLEWALRRLGVDGETAEEMKRMASLDEFRSQLEERARGWTEEWFEQGRVEGIEQGRTEGRVEGERTVLRRLAAVRFGASAKRLDPLFDEVRSAATLAEISEWIMVDPLDQLIAKVEAAVADDRVH